MCTASQSKAVPPAPGLYIVATPIGNLGDLSPRAAGLLETASVVAAEDTRTARKLLRGAPTAARFVSLTEHNVEQRIPGLIASTSTGAVVLVSDAGTPGIADPGARLVHAAHREGVRVFSVPGPSALAAALAASGFDTSWSLFMGFPPRKRGERVEAFRRAGESARVVVFFESPGRLAASLRAAVEALGDVEAVVCREVSKLHEEIVYGPAADLAERFAEAKGECTVVLRVPERGETEASRETALDMLAGMKRAGARRSLAAAEIARRGVHSRDELYRAWDDLR